MLLNTLKVSLGLLVGGAAATAQGSAPAHTKPSFSAKGVHVGNSLSHETDTFASFHLDSDSRIATVDFDVERAGYPFFTVSSLEDGPVQIEVKYSEQFNALSEPWSDGPYPFALALANGFRVETFNATKEGRIESPLIQGGQRWFSFKLLTKGGVTIDEVGLVATVDTAESDELPGQFDCDDEDLNAIWKLGAVAALTSCVGKGTQKAIWDIDSEKGALVRNLRPSQSLSASMISNYTLDFDVLIQRGGIWWNVAFPLSANSGIQLMLTGELPEDSTFANTNRTLTPANSLTVATGFAFVNQTTLPSTAIGTYDVPFNVHEDTWYHITTALEPSGNLTIAINNTNVLNMAIPGGSSFGSFGFGAWQDQEAYVRNVVVTDTANGTTLFSNPMTNAGEVLPEFGAQANLESVCLDGPKRDRLVWLGDFYHTSRIIGVSTLRHDLFQGTLDFVLRTQIDSGDVNTAPAMSYDPAVQEPFLSTDGSLGMPDYHILGLLSFHQYARQTKDVDWIKHTWPKWQLAAEGLISNLNKTDGLLYISLGFVGSANGGSADSCALAGALSGMAEVATLIGDDESAKKYKKVTGNLSKAINDRLWNDKIGAYSWDASNPDAISASGTGLCITSGVASGDQATRSLKSINSIANGPGYKDSTLTDDSKEISPFMNGFLLPAFFGEGATLTSNSSKQINEKGMNLIGSLWGAMTADEQTASGASWEYVKTDGSPGLGLFTSLGHPWGGAATYVLTEYVAGLRAAEGISGFAYENWVVAPGVGVDYGLKRASAKIETPSGKLSVNWKVIDGKLEADVRAPTGTAGTFILKGEKLELKGKSQYKISRDLRMGLQF